LLPAIGQNWVQENTVVLHTLTNELQHMKQTTSMLHNRFAEEQQKTAMLELELTTMKKMQALEHNNHHQQIMKTSMVHALEKELRLKTKKLKALTRERTREKEMKEQVAVADRAIEEVRKEQRKTVTLSNIEQIKARRKSSAVARGERRKMHVHSNGGGAKDRKNKGALPLVERVAEEVYDERHEYLSKTMHRGVEGEGGVRGLPSLEAEYSHRDRLTQAYERLRERNLQQGAFSNTL
jgi:predicted RNase H-like nuclease (RuvC/YqgF family)